MTNYDPAYIELLYLEEAAKELADDKHLTEEEAKTIVWAKAGRKL